jgi:RNA polymerase primary sigma factor
MIPFLRLALADETKLFERFRSGDEEAGSDLALAYMPLVRSLASRARRNNQRFVVLDDLIGAGCEGLMIALNKFDHSRGIRFSAYARWYIKDSIKKCVRNERWWAPHIPDHVHRAVIRVLKTQQRLRRALGRDPTVRELSGEMDIPINRLQRLLGWIHTDVALSLSLPIGDGDSSLADALVDRRVVSPLEAVENQNLKENMADVLKTLSPPEEKVAKHLFGLADGSEQTLEEVGQQFAVTRERVRQIEAKLIRKLRHPTRNTRLRGFAMRERRQGR